MRFVSLFVLGHFLQVDFACRLWEVEAMIHLPSPLEVC